MKPPPIAVVPPDANARFKNGARLPDPEEDAGRHVEQWPAPIPFGAAPVPPFPVHLLSPSLRAFADAVAEFAQVPVDMVAALLLAAVAACVQRRLVVEVRDGYVEPLSLYVVVTSEPGTRKTSVMAEITRFIREWEVAEAIKLGPQIEEARSARAIKEKRKAALQDAAARAKTIGESGEKAREAQKLAAELAAETSTLGYPRILADDVTPEALARLMAEHGERMALFSAEGGIFDIMGGRYSATVNLDVFLKGHAGEDMRVDRRNADPLVMRSPALTMGLAVQPEVLRGLADKPSFRGRGLLARPLYALPANLVGRRRIDTAPVPASARAGYHRCITRLLNVGGLSGSDPVPLRFSPEALDEWRALSMRLEPRLGRGGDLNHIADWAGKAAGAAVRLAGLFHAVACAEDGMTVAGEIDGDTMQRAAELVETYFIPHAVAAFAQMGADPEVMAAESLVHWLQARNVDEVSVRDAFQGLRGQARFRRVDAVEQAFTLAEQHGYVRRLPAAPRSGPGRPAAARYAVYPQTEQAVGWSR